MRLISPLLKRVIYPALSATGRLRPHGPAGQIAILTYHGVRPEGYVSRDPVLDGHLVTPEAFRAQLRQIKKLYRVISPEAFRIWLANREPLPAFSILLTCDDGLLNVLTDMLPILREEEVPCLFFVTGASAANTRGMLWYEDLFLMFLNARPGTFGIACEGIKIQGQLNSVPQRRAAWWAAVRQLSQLEFEKRSACVQASCAYFALEPQSDLDSRDSAWCRRFGLLKATELSELGSGGMMIGAHTVSHPILSLAPPELAYAEISESKMRLESALGRRVWAFAYPFGDPESVNADVMKMTRDAGFEAAFMNFGGGFGTILPQFSLPRLHITADMNLAEFEAHVCGFHRRLQKCAGRASEASTY